MIIKRENNIPHVILLTAFFTVLLSFLFSGCAARRKALNVIKGKSQIDEKAPEDKEETKKKKGKYVWVQRPLEEESVVSATARKEPPYAMNFENITISEFIEAMMAGVFKQNYLITDGVRALGKRFTNSVYFFLISSRSTTSTGVSSADNLSFSPENFSSLMNLCSGKRYGSLYIIYSSYNQSSEFNVEALLYFTVG